MTRTLRPLAWVFFLVAAPALAQPAARLAPNLVPDQVASNTNQGRPEWSIISAKTIGEGQTVLNFQVGYPGISAAILGGINDRFDFGGKFTFLYGSEASTFVSPGLRLQGLLRFLVAERGRVRFGIELEPGIYTYFGTPGRGAFGVALPLKFTIGIPLLKELSLHAGVDLPLMFGFVPGFTAAIPVLLGGGIEYLVIPDLSLNFRMRFGPSIIVTPGGSGVGLGLDVLLGVAYRL